MQVKIDMKCMQTNFGGCGYYGFGDFVFFIVCHRNGQIFPSDHGIYVNTCRAKVNKMMVQLKASAYCIVYTTITQSINIEVQYDACTFYMYIYTSA